MDYLEIKDDKLSESKGNKKNRLLTRENVTIFINILMIMSNVILITYYVGKLNDKVNQINGEVIEYKRIFDVIIQSYPNLTNIQIMSSRINEVQNEISVRMVSNLQSLITVNKTINSVNERLDNSLELTNIISKINIEDMRNTIRLLNNTFDIPIAFELLSEANHAISIITNSTINCLSELIIYNPSDSSYIPINFTPCKEGSYFGDVGCRFDTNWHGNDVYIINSTTWTYYMNGVKQNSVNVTKIIESKNKFLNQGCVYARDFYDNFRWGFRYGTDLILPNLKCADSGINKECIYVDDDYQMNC